MVITLAIVWPLLEFTFIHNLPILFASHFYFLFNFKYLISESFVCGLSFFILVIFFSSVSFWSGPDLVTTWYVILVTTWYVILVTTWYVILVTTCQNGRVIYLKKTIFMSVVFDDVDFKIISFITWHCLSPSLIKTISVLHCLTQLMNWK